jgi:ParB-like chromosome segregation protein Spo0J
MAKTAQTSPPIEIDIHIELWPIERLIPRANNPRTHSRQQVAQIGASIREYGWTNPILVGADDDVIAGHARELAAKKLRMKEVPIILLRHLTEAQRRALVIADNELALNAGWDETALRTELEALREADYNLDLIGFDDIELQRLLEAQHAAPGLTDEDAVPDVPQQPTTLPGDVWLMDKHRLPAGSRAKSPSSCGPKW